MHAHFNDGLACLVALEAEGSVEARSSGLQAPGRLVSPTVAGEPAPVPATLCRQSVTTGHLDSCGCNDGALEELFHIGKLRKAHQSTLRVAPTDHTTRLGSCRLTL